MIFTYYLNVNGVLKCVSKVGSVSLLWLEDKKYVMNKDDVGYQNLSQVILNTKKDVWS